MTLVTRFGAPRASGPSDTYRAATSGVGSRRRASGLRSDFRGASLVGGGGVLASSASDTYLVAQDGTTTLLDLDGAMSGGGFVGFDWGSWLAANADGTVCGNHGGAGLVLACKESDGTVHVGEALPFDTSDARGGLLPLPDGRFLISATGHGSYALDPGDASVTLLDTRTVTDVVWDPDGHLWGIDEVTREVLHYDGSTVEVLDLPLPATQVIATREVVWVDGWRMPR